MTDERDDYSYDMLGPERDAGCSRILGALVMGLVVALLLLGRGRHGRRR